MDYKKFRITLGFAMSLFVVFQALGPGLFGVKVALAHTASPACESITLAEGPSQSIAVLTPGNINVAGNGTSNVPAGTYTITWSDNFVLQGVVVPACPQAPQTGTITVCKVVIDEQDNVVAGDDGTTFTIPWLNANYEGANAGVPSSAVFNTPISLSHNIFGSTEIKEGQCKDYTLPLGRYYYGQEVIGSPSQWETPLYNDQYNVQVQSLSDFFPFDVNNNQNDNSDGVINISAQNSHRTLIVLNQMKALPPPSEQENTCLLPTTLEGAKITSFGASPENTTQMILDSGGYSINTVADETGYQAWNVPAGTASVTFTAKLVGGLAGNTNTFGYYTNSDVSNFTPMFSKPSTVDGFVSAPVVIDTTGVTTISFAIQSKDGNNVTKTFATEVSENASSEDHAAVYNYDENKYVIAFEDLLFSSSDKDYNDMVVDVNITECTQVSTKCEPDKELILNGDFEAPDVTTGNYSIFPQGTLGLEWLLGWVSPQTTGIEGLEIQDNVAGAPDTGSGDQFAELDGDHPVSIWQNIATVPGKEYKISFKYSPRPGTESGTNKIEARADGSLLALLTGAGGGSTSWTPYSYNFVASDSNTEIKFTDIDTDNSYGGYLDDVSVRCLVRGEPQDPGTSKIHLKKFVDGQVPSQSLEQVFTVQTGLTWGNPNAGNFNGGINLNPLNSFMADTVAITNGNNSESFYEVTGGETNVLPADSQCVPGKYQVVGYTYSGISFADAASKEPGSPTGLTLAGSITSDQYVIVWNHLCPTPPPPSVNIIATKIVCTNEADLPNYGNGGPNITGSTATDWISPAHPSCRLEQGWQFEWAPTGTPDAGMALVGPAGGAWYTSGLTAVDGTVSINLPLPEGDHPFVWFREVLKTGYIPFTFQTPGHTQNDNPVSAEIYCNTDVLNYDNYDRVDNLIDGQTFYCVAWNVPTDVCPNLEGLQAVVPEGYVTNDAGQCVLPPPPPPTDVCSNIDGIQASVPEGMVLSDGQCVTPEVVVTDPAITKTVDNGTPAPGATIVYTLVVSNNSSITATNITVTDPMPVGVTYVSDDGSTDTTFALNTLTWVIPSIPASGSVTLHISVTINGNATGAIHNVASITGGATEGNSNTSNDSDDADVTVTPPIITSCEDTQSCRTTEISFGGGGGRFAGATSGGGSTTPPPTPAVLGASVGLPDTGLGPITIPTITSSAQTSKETRQNDVVVLTLMGIMTLIALNLLSIKVLTLHK